MLTTNGLRALALTLLFLPGTVSADPTTQPGAARPIDETPFASLLMAQAFNCTGRTCGQMSSCAEACHALLVCGDRARDGDNDGIPCENLCSRRC